MKYYPINLVQQKLYANENVFINYHLINNLFIKLLFQKKKKKNRKKDNINNVYIYYILL